MCAGPEGIIEKLPLTLYGTIPRYYRGTLLCTLLMYYLLYIYTAAVLYREYYVYYCRCAVMQQSTPRCTLPVQ